MNKVWTLVAVAMLALACLGGCSAPAEEAPTEGGVSDAPTLPSEPQGNPEL